MNTVVWEQPRHAVAARKTTPDTPNDLLTLRELADVFPGIGYCRVSRMAYLRTIPVYRLGATLFVSRREFAEFVAARREPARV